MRTLPAKGEPARAVPVDDLRVRQVQVVDCVEVGPNVVAIELLEMTAAELADTLLPEERRAICDVARLLSAAKHFGSVALELDAYAPIPVAAASTPPPGPRARAAKDAVTGKGLGL